MSEIESITELVKRAIDAETGSPFGVANVCTLALYAIAIVAESAQQLIVFLAVKFGRACLYAFDRCCEWIWFRHGLEWQPRPAPTSRVPLPGPSRMFVWLFWGALFCPTGLMIIELS